MQPWLQLIGITKSYATRKILDRLNLEVQQGEVFTLLGPSGTGKSTVLKAIAGLVGLDAGSIYLAGRDITSAPAQSRNVGLVFQDYSLFPSMSVRENVAFPLLARRTRGLTSLLKWQFNRGGRHEVYARVADVLNLVHLTEHAEKRPNQLSGGEQQRAALARALAFDPALLCLDEPFSALDKNLRQELQQQIRDLQQRLGKTVLYVTHDQSEAMLVSTRIGILHRGVIEQIGSPEEVYSRPATAFVARFLGDCNILDVSRIEIQHGSPTIVTQGGTMFVSSTLPKDGQYSIAVRPEKLRVVRHSSGDGPTIAGTIDARMFLGAQVRFEIRLESGERIRSLLLTDDDHLPQQGEAVHLSYNPADICVIPREPLQETGIPGNQALH